MASPGQVTPRLCSSCTAFHLVEQGQPKVISQHPPVCEALLPARCSRLNWSESPLFGQEGREYALLNVTGSVLGLDVRTLGFGIKGSLPSL